MKKIIVAGAGHGGLIASYHLAKAGYDVTVYERQQRENLGHDWHDYLDMTAFDGSDIPRPDESMYRLGAHQAFRNPKGNVKVEVAYKEDARVMDRKVLYRYILSLCDEAGVKFVFGTEITGVTFTNRKITGLKIIKDGVGERVYADLVIDAAGMYSPVRRNLPAYCGIQREIEKKDIFHVYRAYYKNSEPVNIEPSYVMDLFHMNRPGLDWTIFEEDYTDILLGKFGAAGELTQDEIKAALEGYRRDYPFITEEIVRGGCVRDIPISKMLPLIVADGYAAVGDSAAMTVPLNGSGIVLSMNAGKLLADAVIEAEGKTDKAALWKYQYKYFTALAKDYVIVAKLKDFFTFVDGSLVDYFLEANILSAELLACGNGDINIPTKQIFYILSKAGPILKLTPDIIRNFKTVIRLPSAIKDMPEEYDAEKVSEWVENYKKI